MENNIKITDNDILNYLLRFSGKTKKEIEKDIKLKYKSYEEFKIYILKEIKL